MPRLSLTSKLVDNAPLPRDRKSVEYFDHRMPGLVLRVSAGGTKSWNAVYRHHGRARRLTIGRYPIITLDDARARARDALCEVSRGVDPSGVRVDKLTFAELASIFVEGHVRKLRRARQVERLIEREIRRCLETPFGEFYRPPRCCAARRGCRGTRACAGEPRPCDHAAPLRMGDCAGAT
jgi:hypothetical protein